MFDKNLVLEKIAAGKPALGCQNRTGNAEMSEIIGECGFDYCFIETEHYVQDPKEVLNVIRACELVNVEPIVRIVDHDRGKVQQMLDIGAKGIIFPHVDTAEECKKVIEMCKYSPIGTRGYSNNCRACIHGSTNIREYMDKANKNVMAIPMIESKEAVENIDAILACKPDALQLGPGDLSDSYGCEPKDKPVQDAMDYVFKKANAVGIPCACVAANPTDAANYVKRGAKLVSYSSDVMLFKKAGSEAVKAINEELK